MGRRQATRADLAAAAQVPVTNMRFFNFAESMVIEAMKGLGANYRSRYCAGIIPLGCESKRFHIFLAVKHASCDAAAEYTAKLKDRCRDSVGRIVEMLHKGATAGRPTHILRRGQRFHPFYTLFSKCLKLGEEPQPHRVMRGDACRAT